MWDGDCPPLNDRVDPTAWTELVNCPRPKRLASRALPGTELGPNPREEASMSEETPEGLDEGRTLRDLLDEYERDLIVSPQQANGGTQRPAAAPRLSSGDRSRVAALARPAARRGARSPSRLAGPTGGAPATPWPARPGPYRTSLAAGSDDGRGMARVLPRSRGAPPVRGHETGPRRGLRPGAPDLLNHSRCLRRKARVRGQAFWVALRFAPSRPDWARRNPWPAPS